MKCPKCNAVFDLKYKRIWHSKNCSDTYQVRQFLNILDMQLHLIWGDTPPAIIQNLKERRE